MNKHLNIASDALDTLTELSEWLLEELAAPTVLGTEHRLMPLVEQLASEAWRSSVLVALAQRPTD